MTNAHIIDPQSGTDFTGSLGIKNGKIDGLFEGGKALPSAKETIDLEGAILVPGFIDIHSHCENSIPCAEKLLAMGVTTAISGNCGYSTENFKSFFTKHEKNGFPINQLEQVGHSILRRKAGITDINSPASDSQIEKMKTHAVKAFSEGACGLSFGLEYDPGSSEIEVIEMARTAAEAGRFVSIHGRVRAWDDLDSLYEALALAPLTGAEVIYSHLVYMYNGKELKEALRIITEHREKKSPVWVDSGMYTAFSTIAGSPAFNEETFLSSETELKRLRGATGKYAGQVMDRDKYIEMRKFFPREHFIYDPGDIEDVFIAYSLPDVMVSCDSLEYPAGQGHPQGAATYPYFFRMLVKERKQLSLSEAVRRCSLLPAQAAGLDTKGSLSCGMDADLVVLDWDNLYEHADFPDKGDPNAPPSGIKYVFVNGAMAICNEKRIKTVNAGHSIRR